VRLPPLSCLLLSDPTLSLSLIDGQGLAALKNCIVNINSRICPTTFVLVPFPKQDTEAERRGLLGRVSRLYRAVASPKETVLDLLQDRYYIALVCEVCRLHPEDRELWYLIEKPKEVVGKILPLARAGLQFAFVLNKVSALGRIFGLPTPVLQDSTLSGGLDFISDLESGTLSDYAELERVAQENYSTSPSSVSSTTSSGEDGYCVREFSLFLAKVDSEKRWANLSARVNDKGDLCYVCPSCLSGSRP
jgi:hypothetical protein